ncbi:MAG TPA: hypothetical protein VGF17_16040 [Phytomonospora sp.]
MARFEPYAVCGGRDADGVDAAVSPDLILDAVRRVPGVDLVPATGDIGAASSLCPGVDARAVKGAGATVVELGGPYSPMFHTSHARDPEAGEQVHLVDAVSGEDVDRE